MGKLKLKLAHVMPNGLLYMFKDIAKSNSHNPGKSPPSRHKLITGGCKNGSAVVDLNSISTASSQLLKIRDAGKDTDDISSNGDTRMYNEDMSSSEIRVHKIPHQTSPEAASDVKSNRFQLDINELEVKLKAINAQERRKYYSVPAFTVVMPSPYPSSAQHEAQSSDDQNSYSKFSYFEAGRDRDSSPSTSFRRSLSSSSDTCIERASSSIWEKDISSLTSEGSELFSAFEDNEINQFLKLVSGSGSKNRLRNFKHKSNKGSISSTKATKGPESAMSRKLHSNEHMYVDVARYKSKKALGFNNVVGVDLMKCMQNDDDDQCMHLTLQNEERKGHRRVVSSEWESLDTQIFTGKNVRVDDYSNSALSDSELDTLPKNYRMFKLQQKAKRMSVKQDYVNLDVNKNSQLNSRTVSRGRLLDGPIGDQYCTSFENKFSPDVSGSLNWHQSKGLVTRSSSDVGVYAEQVSKMLQKHSGVDDSCSKDDVFSFDMVRQTPYSSDEVRQSLSSADMALRSSSSGACVDSWDQGRRISEIDPYGCLMSKSERWSSDIGFGHNLSKDASSLYNSESFHSLPKGAEMQSWGCDPYGHDHHQQQHLYKGVGRSLSCLDLRQQHVPTKSLSPSSSDQQHNHPVHKSVIAVKPRQDKSLRRLNPEDEITRHIKSSASEAFSQSGNDHLRNSNRALKLGRSTSPSTRKSLKDANSIANFDGEKNGKAANNIKSASSICRTHDKAMKATSTTSEETAKRRAKGTSSVSNRHSHNHNSKVTDSVAMVKSSYDPTQDFKESMMEMIQAKGLKDSIELVDLLQCYLTLNSSHYHHTILKAFNEVWSELFGPS